MQKNRMVTCSKYTLRVNPIRKPIVAMGQFYHEAAAIDPETGVVYMTEDTEPHAGLYRYLPRVPGQLQAGGKLQMLKVDGHRAVDLRRAIEPADGIRLGRYRRTGAGPYTRNT